MLTCKQASQLVSELQERELSRRERWALKTHLWICISCRRFSRQLNLLRRALRLMAQGEETQQHGPELSPQARQRIRRALAEDDNKSH